MEAISQAIDEVEDSPAVRAGIVTGAGGVFCSGADLRSRMAGKPSVNEHGFAGLTRRRRTKPLVAAVEGYCLGGGMELALACDLIVAAQNATFGLPEVKAGLIAAEGGLIRVVGALGKLPAMQLALLGEPISAERAHTLGLVCELVPTGDALPRARELAGRIAALPAAAVRGTKLVVDEVADENNADAWRVTQETYRAVRRDPGFRQAVASVLDGRSGA
jgi:enoyl-CoA hydratase